MTKDYLNYIHSLGVNDKEKCKNLRLNLLHMRGTEGMNTKDVFKYFEDYAPVSVEWLSDMSCMMFNLSICVLCLKYRVLCNIEVQDLQY